MRFLSFDDGKGGGLLPDDRGPSVAEQLAELGFDADEVERLEQVIDREAAIRGRREAAGFVRVLLEKVSKVSAAGAAVRAALTPEVGPTTAMADGLGVSKQAIGVFLPRVRAAVGPLAPARNVKRPTEPGRWMTRPEARAAFGLSADRLVRLGPRSVPIGMTLFVDADDLEKRIAAWKVGEAAARLKRRQPTVH